MKTCFSRRWVNEVIERRLEALEARISQLKPRNEHAIQVIELSARYSELRLLQNELKGAAHANDAD